MLEGKEFKKCPVHAVKFMLIPQPEYTNTFRMNVENIFNVDREKCKVSSNLSFTNLQVNDVQALNFF